MKKKLVLLVVCLITLASGYLYYVFGVRNDIIKTITSYYEMEFLQFFDIVCSVMYIGAIFGILYLLVSELSQRKIIGYEKKTM